MTIESTETIAIRRSGLRRRRLVAAMLRTPSVMMSVGWLLVVIALAFIVAPMIADEATRQVLANRFAEPFTLDNGFFGILGADALGRPMMLQMIIGAQTSLIVAACSVGLSAIIGTVIGIISGYYGGWLDAILMRIVDILHTIPSLLLALAVLYVLQPSVMNLIAVLAVTRIPVYLRTARAQALELRERVFVESARSIGSSSLRIMSKDITPMLLPTAGTLAMLEIAMVILQAAGLSFLGIGLQRPDVDWGMIVADGRSYLTQAWWVTLFPGLMIVFTALSANIISNWFRAMQDPQHAAPVGRRLRRQRRTEKPA